jgi:hypothetical protein
MQNTEIQVKFAKTLYRQKSEGLFFLFSFFPSQNWKQQQGMKKKQVLIMHARLS